MKNLIFCIAVFFTVNVQAQWVQKNTPVSSHILRIHFINEDIGIAVGSLGKILKTYDGGESWVEKNSQTTDELYALDFNSQGIGFAAGNNGVICFSTDFGETWEPEYKTREINDNDELINFRSCRVFNDTVFYLSGSYGTIYKIENNGADWTDRHVDTPNTVYDVHFLNENLAYATGLYGMLLKTTDGGLNWEGQISPTSKLLATVWFTNMLTGFAAGFDGTLCKTSDGGENWTLNTSMNSDDYLTTIRFIDATKGYIIGGDINLNAARIYFTDDGGLSWGRTELPFTRAFSGCFLAEGTGYICGLDGMIIKNEGLPSVVMPGMHETMLNQYPNPVASAVTVELDKEIAEITGFVYNVTGQVVEALKLYPADKKVKINVSGLDPGIYVVRLSGYKQSFRIVKI